MRDRVPVDALEQSRRGAAAATERSTLVDNSERLRRHSLPLTFTLLTGKAAPPAGNKSWPRNVTPITMKTNQPDVAKRFALAVARVTIIATTLTALAACSRPWPKLPPRSYSGLIINGATNEPAAGAVVQATRSDLVGIISLLHGTETIGCTVTDEAGRFDLTTREGYSDLIVARSPDRRLVGRSRIKTRDSVSGIVITMEAYMSGVATGSGFSPEDVSEIAGEAIQAMVDFIASHPDEPLRSLDGYRNIGVLTAEQHGEFILNQRLYFGSHPDVWFHWGEFTFVFNSASEPIQFKDFPIGKR